MTIAIDRWTHPKIALKKTTEMGQIFIAHPFSNLLNGACCVSQNIPRIAQADLVKIGYKGFTYRIFKPAGKGGTIR